jgi:two-component system, chemotaxis family, sensor kinase Cph1
MDDKINKDELRKKAEEVYQSMIISDKDNANENVHELHVHQIELEIQNQELRETQINLEDSRRKYFDLYNFAPVGYFTLDKDGIILELNLAGAALLGVERIKLQNMAFIRYISSEDRSRFHQHIINAVENKNKQTIEIKMLKKGNEPLYAHLETINVRDEEGNFKEFRVMVTDVTDIKTSENKLSSILERERETKKELEKTIDELYRSRDEYRIMGETLPYGVWRSDAKGKLLYASQTFLDLLGMELEDIQGFGWTQRLLPEEVETKKNNWIHCVKTGEQWDNELKVLGSDGKYHTVLTRGLPVRDNNGNIKSWVGINLNIDDRKQIEEELRKVQDELELKVKNRTLELESVVTKLKHSNQELQQFANVSAHDLQEPLRIMASFTQLLERRYKGKFDDDADEFIYYIVDAAKRMQTLINDLLEYSRVGRKGIEYELTNIEELIDGISYNLKDSVKENLELSYDPLPEILADKGQLILLFQNLIGNSIKFKKVDEPLNIHITAFNDGINKDYLFTVTDNGIGIDPQYAEQIFEIFQRLHSIKEYSGTGIGLSICKKILDNHGGQIWVDSELGKGSTFYFTLPII